MVIILADEFRVARITVWSTANWDGFPDLNSASDPPRKGKPSQFLVMGKPNWDGFPDLNSASDHPRKGKPS